MIRFIIKRQTSDNIAGYKTEGYETADIDVPELEAILLGGGFGPNGCDVRELFACEVIAATPANEGKP